MAVADCDWEVVPLVGFGPADEVLEAGPEVVGNGHQVVYWVTTSLMVTVAVDTKAGETDSEQAWDSQEVMVTKVVESFLTVVVLTAATTAVTVATAAAVENCIVRY